MRNYLTRMKTTVTQPKALLRALVVLLKAVAVVFLVIISVTIVASVWGVRTVKVAHYAPPPTINDVTKINPIPVDSVLTPTTTAEIIEAVRTHAGPISIGGGRYSMGGQTATEGALQIDMRTFNKVIAFDSIGKTITVQPGIRWRQIQDRIDPANLSIKIMQTYSNFTVGGSLSVNVHGRYIGLGPLILSVRSIKLVLADGTLIEASPKVNPELFYGAVGGYGGIGVIVEATLELADNVHVKRVNQTMPIGEYNAFFRNRIRDSANVIFHNGDIYPNEFERVNAVTWVQTNEPVTVKERLIPRDTKYGLNRFVYWVMSEWPGGKEIREHIVDPLIMRGHPVEYRNYEASYDVGDLEPTSRAASTYVLQEYFVPVARFDEFVPKMRAVFHKHDVNVINVSIRHALPDPGSLLGWARQEVFAFVVYYKQGTDDASRQNVGIWTREMIDSVLTVDGAYYLPYQPWATDDQFLRAYPHAPEYFALKKRVDPTNKFRNRLWDKYYLPRATPALADVGADVRARLDTTKGYRRDEGQTYLTHPEWYIVYSSDEYANWLQQKQPTNFPYLKSIGQYWALYDEAEKLTTQYPFNSPYHVMLGVIGVSYSAELALKGIYENTIGRFSGWTNSHRITPEDKFAANIASDYGRFIHIRPWYEYKFAQKLGTLWFDTPRLTSDIFRRLERRFFLTMEWGIKAVYATIIEKATRGAYEPEADEMKMVVTGWSDAVARDKRIIFVAQLDSVHALIKTPRYDVFRDIMLDLARQNSGLRIIEIAGNDEIFLTGVAPIGWHLVDADAQTVQSLPVPSYPRWERFGAKVRVKELLGVLRTMQSSRDVTVDHIYDY
jgi:FAD/FMN-containing dehydrogenase